MNFAYSLGQRPLGGYTIKRGVGRGALGEVYHAGSDNGQEVALRRIHRDLDIDLLAISQCRNFTHPHLVNLHDLRTDAQGEHWAVMEYLTGPTLSVVLQRHPDGVPPALARQCDVRRP